jgi:hypothetical protein
MAGDRFWDRSLSMIAGVMHWTHFEEDCELWEEELQERRAWDVTLMDGIEDE